MRHILLFVLIGYFCQACQQPNPPINIIRHPVTLDSSKFYSVADTLIADMVVKNPDTEDWWTEKCLKQLKRNQFVDTIFKQLYESKLIAYDYYSGQPLSIRQIRELEHRNDFNRNIVGKFQFYEGWFYAPQQKIFIKKVYAIIFGYEIFDDKGLVKGYKPMFKIIFE
jgi:hypothetical protein